MSDRKVHEIDIRTDDGKRVTVRVRVEGRCDEDGVEGVLLAVLHPTSDFEVMKYWTPIAANPSLSVLTKD